MSNRYGQATLAILLAMGLAGSACAGPQPVAPEARAFTIGALQAVALRDALNPVANDGKVLGTNVTPADVAKVLAAAHQPTDTTTLGVDALLVKVPGHVVLIDTGLGPKVKGVLAESLKQFGVTPDQVTDILITHSHGDHVGGLVGADGKPAFAHATIRMSAAEWAYLQSQSQAQALVQAITPQVKPFEPGGEVVPGITSVAIAGHTPGHVGYEIRSGNAKLLDIGDTAHSAIVSLAKPDWTIAYDKDAKTGAASRRATLARLAASHELVFAPHFPFPGVGRIVAKGDGFVWAPTLR